MSWFMLFYMEATLLGRFGDPCAAPGQSRCWEGGLSYDSGLGGWWKGMVKADIRPWGVIPKTEAPTSAGFG